LLFNAKWAIFQLYHGENKLIFLWHEIWRKKTNMLSWDYYSASSLKQQSCSSIRTHYSDSEPTSLCSYSLILHVLVEKQNYPFNCLWFEPTRGSNPPSSELYQLMILPIHKFIVIQDIVVERYLIFFHVFYYDYRYIIQIYPDQGSNAQSTTLKASMLSNYYTTEAVNELIQFVPIYGKFFFKFSVKSPCNSCMW
jgi:hypothetical protein